VSTPESQPATPTEAIYAWSLGPLSPRKSWALAGLGLLVYFDNNVPRAPEGMTSRSVIGCAALGP